LRDPEEECPIKDMKICKEPGFTCLGAPIGDNNWCKNYVHDKLSKCYEAVDQLIRIRSRAVRQNKVFRIIIVLPVHPEGTFKDDAGIRFIMKWQFKTINR